VLDDEIGESMELMDDHLATATFRISQPKSSDNHLALSLQSFIK